MRIVFVANHASVHTRRWVAFFADRGHDVRVVTCGGADAVDLDTQGNVIGRNYRIVDLGSPRLGKLGYLFKLRRARRAIRRANAEVVHAHWATSYGLLALVAGVRPLVVTAHGDDLLIAPRNRIMRAIVLRVLRAAALITVPSEPMRQAAHALLGDEGAPEVAVFQYGVEVRRLTALAASVRSQIDPRDIRPLRIVSARALLRLYRVDVLLDALALLAAQHVDFECELLGDGPERASLEAQAARLGIAHRCNFRGAVEPSEVEQVVAKSDIYVSVAESDGVSLALLEAMVLGAIPVLSDIPANRGWVNDGATGMLTEIEPAAVASAIRAAARIDAPRAGKDNCARVSELADRETNLAACELLIDSLVGVTFDPRPVDDSAAA